MLGQKTIYPNLNGPGSNLPSKEVRLAWREVKNGEVGVGTSSN